MDAPLFVTWFQCLFSATVCFTLSRLGQRYPHHLTFPAGHPFAWSRVRSVLPLAILFTLTIATNNLCLKYVDVSFYYVSRSLTTVFNVLLSWALLRQRTSAACCWCCALIVGGFCLGVDQEHLTASFSALGTAFGVASSAALSLYSIYTKKTLPAVGGEVWLLSYCNNVYSVVLFVPLMLVNGEVQRVWAYERLGEPWFWMAMCAGGLCGLAIGYVTTLQIKVTSPLTHNISGTAKACAQTVLASQLFGEWRSALWWLSNGVVLAGSALYTRLKQVEMRREHQQQQIQQQRVDKV